MNVFLCKGRLVRDPELKYLGEKLTALCTFTLAVDRDFKAPNGDKQTDFLSCKCWGKTAETVKQYLTKGQLLVVTNSRVEVEKWDTPTGEHREKCIIVIEKWEFGESKKIGDSPQKQDAPSKPQREPGQEPDLDADDPYKEDF